MEQMLLCLSSGYRPRYRHDVLRAISMPEGTHLQFRYESSLIPEGLRQRVKSNDFAGSEVCIAYLDRSKPQQSPEIVPCRVANLIESHLSGDMYILDLCLGQFSVATDIRAFNKDIYTVASNLPYWHGDDICGSFFQLINSMPTTLRKTSDIGDWQALVTTLSTHSDFSTEPFFYYVKSLTNVANKEAIPVCSNVYRIDASKTYQLTIVQYAPGNSLDSRTVGETYWLLVKNEDANVSFTTTKELAIDSPYDEKTVRLRASNPTQATDCVVALLRQITAGFPDPSKAVLDFDLGLQIKPSYGWLVFKGLVVGSLIGAQGLVPIYLNPNITDKWIGYIIVSIAGIAAGLIASFGLRKL